MTTSLLNLLLTVFIVTISLQSSLSQCTSTVTSFPYEEGFETDLGGWTGNTSTSNPPANGTWGRISGTTGSNFTGPTTANEGSFYVYSETSAQSAGVVLDLISPCFALPSLGLPTFSFDYHMWSDPANVTGNGMGSFYLQVDTTLTGSGTWDTLWFVTGNQGDVWNSETVSLVNYLGSTIRLRFQAVTGTGSFIYAGDRAIDNLKLNASGLEFTPIYCQGGSEGSISIITTNFVLPANYVWSNGATTSTITGLGAGAYTVTVTDNNSITHVLSETLLDGTVPVIAGKNYVESFEGIFGDWFNDTINDDFEWTVFTGSTPTGPTGPTAANDGGFYAYTEASGVPASSEAILASPCFDLSGMVSPYFRFDYHMRVQGGGGSSANMGQTYLTVDTTPSTPLTCDTIWFKNGAQGNNWLSDSVDLSPYAGSHVTLKFIGVIASGGITQYGDRAIDGMAIRDVASVTDACDGIAGGAISLNPFFGTSPYSYAWSSSGSGSSISGLAAGTYTVTITDFTNTTQILNIVVDTLNIPIPTGLNASETVFCANQLQTVTLNINYIEGDAVFNGSSATQSDAGPSGSVGTNSYFTINGTPALATGPGVLTISARGDLEAAGEYVQTYSENNILIGITANENGQCNAAYSSNSYTIPADSLNSWAFNDTIGLLAQTFGMTRYCGIGGGQAYSFQAFYNLTYPYTTVIPYWFAGSCDTTIANAIGQGFFVDVNPSTTTTYYVRYYNGFCGSWGDCDSITIQVDSIPAISITPSIASYCNDPVPLTASGANSYVWLPGTGLNSSSAANVLASPSTTITYDVIGTDLNGCFDTTQITVNNVTPLIASVTVDSNTSCFGASDGGATVYATLGSGNYSYLWSTGNTTQSIAGLAAGSYQVTVSDSVGCQDIVSFSITQPSQINVIFTSNDPCNGSSNGTITAIASGGSGGYTYLWNNAQTSVTASGLSAGTYSVTITDANGCIGTGTQTISNAVLTATTSSDSVSCFGGNDGTATATPSGATGPYFYSWLNSAFSPIGQNTQTATGLSAGQYFVQVSSSNGCNVFNGITVQQPSTAVSVSITNSTNVTCNGGSDGTATANTTGGIGSGYTFIWSTGDTTASISNLSAGTYIVSSTDGNGCEDTTQVVISEPAIVSGTTTTTSTLCNGSSDGTATVTPAGGSGSGYTYLWSNGQTTATATGLMAGNYDVTISDGNACTGVASATVGEPTVLVSSTSVTNALCNGSATGTATASATGGTSPYTYAWSNAQTTATANSLAAGTYIVTITDNNGCTVSDTATISEPTSVVSSIASTINVGCFGQNTGTATVAATGGTGAYTYLWSDNSTNATLSSVAAGTYSVTVSDANACTDSSSVTITEPTQVVAVTAVDSNVSCTGGNDGGASASATGGTGSYTYLWSNGQTTNFANGLSAGSYSVIITDANGCSDTASVTITEPAALTASTVADSNISCFNGNDGGATASAVGGTMPYAYTWSNGLTTASITGLSAGTYTVTITDNNQCTDVDTITLTEPAALVATSVADSNVSCNAGNDGGATASATGGTSPYNYAWSNGQTNASVSNLSSGTYSVTITDANGCTDSTSITITEPVTLVASAAIDSNVSCNAGSDAAATASATGGTMPYSFVWSNAQTTATASGLMAGTYSVTITDANGCTDSTSVTISEPTLLVASAVVDSNATCFNISDGVATASASEGTGPYSYLWSDGQTTATANGFIPGSYTVTITDAKGCTDTATISISSPAAIFAATTLDSNVSCNGGSDGGASSSVTGGTGAFTFAWSNGATTTSITGVVANTYVVTITDGIGCADTASVVISEPATLVAGTSLDSNISCNAGNDGGATASAIGGTMPYTYSWSNAATTASISGLIAGTYSVTITDANGCFDSTSITIIEPATLVSSITTDSNVSCNTGSDGGATASAVGGTMPYLYSWSNAATTASITGLTAGTYSVTITDANGCFDSTSVIITEPTAVIASTVVDSNASCNGVSDGVATASAVGGTGTYAFSWSNGQSTATATGLPAGTHTVTITDVNGCTDTETVTITEPATMVAAAIADSNAACNGANNGGATASATGGTMPYSYMWSNSATTASITGIASGTYFVTITDANGCFDTDSVIITEPALLVSNAVLDSNVSCNAGNDGGATASATGGTMPYNFAWSNGATSASITGIAAGTYSVTITDANGCFDSTSITITEPATLVSSIATDSNVSCNTGSDGGATASAVGGTMPYIYSWSNAATTASITGLTAGTYSVTITDANGCFDSASVTITEPTAVVASTVVDSNASCNGVSDGVATASAVGGTEAYAFSWSNGQSTPTATGLPAGTHTVTITDANGCFDTETVVITEPALLVAATVADSNISCNNGTDGGATASATGGTMPYSYMWSNSATTASITGIAAGTYFVTITDANGCFDTDSVIITEPALLVSNAVLDSNVSCNAGNDGGATASATGGTMPYNYMWSNSATTASITGVVAGTYSVTITDANGCFDSTSVTITEPVTLVSSIATDSNVSCNTGSDGGATASATGGTMPYNYMWSNAATTASITGLTAGTYSVTITDDNGCFDSTSVTITEPTAVIASTVVDSNASCNGVSDGVATASAVGGTGAYAYNWSNGQSTATATGLAAGTHTVTITDANGCFDTANVVITEPALLVASTVADSNISCNNGTDGGATASASGGTMPYSYMWSNSATTSSITGIAAGTYFVTITDANGCFDTDSVIITEPALLVSSAVLDSNVSCNAGNDGGATASATGGTMPYSYTWSNGVTSASITGVAAGTYSITITDANGCFDSTSITITEPATLVSSIVTDSNVSCNTGSDGGATALAVGGTMPYNYMWSNAATTASITGLTAGTYSVTITDDNGCFDSASVTITEPTAVVASTVVDSNASCNGVSDGVATASAVGGTGAYAFSWSNGQSTATATGLPAGTHTVTITDVNGCFDTANVIITEPALLVASTVSDNNVNCNGGTDGQATASAVGGTTPYSYLWSNGQTTATATGLAAATYFVTITDSNGCFDTDSVVISEPTVLIASISLDSNASCFGTATGGATASATGGVGPYFYNWTHGPSNANIDGLAAGTYTVIILDQNACTDSSTITITEPTALSSASVQLAAVNCFGGNDGSATAAPSGGTAPYSYLWSSGETTDTANALIAGTQFVTVTDANGCGYIDSVTIAEPATSVSTTTQVLNNVLCNGDNSALGFAVATGGTPGYTYAWGNGTNNDTANFSVGTWFVTATDANGCFVVDSVVITEPGALASSIDSTHNISCFGLIDGELFASAAFGTAPYSFSWSNGDTTASISGLAIGSYQLTITDINGCTDTTSGSITSPDSISNTFTINNVSCNAGADGYLIANASGGTAPYNYAWSGSTTTSDSLGGLIAGSYQVSITDNNNCVNVFTEVITEPTLLTATATAFANVSCNGDSSGIAIASANGGTTPYTFTWPAAFTTNGDTVFGLPAGTFAVTVTDGNNCSATDNVTITEPNALVISIDSSLDVNCVGGNDGFASVAVTGGTGTYNYNWSNGSTNSSISNLILGTYCVTVSDANGCSDSICVTISETNALPIVNLGADYNSCDTVTTVDAGSFSSYAWSTSATSQTIDITTAGIYAVTVTDANGCQNSDQISVGFNPYLSYDVTTDSSACSQATGAAHITNLTGGGGYSINWSTGQVGGLNLLNLASGNYSVNISDQNGCSVNTPFTVQDLEPITVFTTITPVTCVNSADGAIAIDSTLGSSLPASYLWSNGDTTSSLSGLTAGTYNLTITGTFGCQTFYSYSVGSPTPITFNVSVQNSTCTDSNGVATITGLLPTGSYTYQWNDYLSQTTLSASNLPAGNYTVTVTNAAGCTKVKNGIVNDLSAASLALSANDATCEGQTSGDATVVATGNGPFTYAWNDPNSQTVNTAINLANGSYYVTVTDANSCLTIDSVAVGFTNSNPTVSLGADTNVCANFFILSPGSSFSNYAWSNGSSNASISATSTGNYAVTVTDANGCEAADTIDLTLNTPISFTANQTNSSCTSNSGSVVLNVLSGGGSYVYNWSNGANTSSITNLGNGTYNVTITDANGCQADDSYTIIQTTAPTLAATLVDPICNAGTDGNISVTATGGTAPLTYAWSNGATSNNPSNLMAGAYNVTVTDDSGCVVLGNYILDQPTPITIGFSVVPSSCGNADGSAEALISGNQGPASFIWNDANATDSALLVNVTSGTYQVTVTDSAGCSNTNAANISDFGAAVVSTGSINNNCDNEASGQAYAVATGIGPFSYAWNDATSQTTDTASNLANGSYTISVTDLNGCLTIASTSVSSFYEAPEISLGDDVSTCEGNEVILTAGGGFSSYNWNTGETTVDISPTASGPYSITVTDVNACSNFDATVVNFVLPPVVDLGADTIICLDDQPLSFTLDATENFVNYVWNTGDTTSTIVVNNTGVYSVNVDNGDKCVGTDAIIVVFDTCVNVGQDEIAGFISEATLTLYPNPTRGSFVIETSGLQTGDYLVRLNSISGQMVEKRNLNITTGIDSRDEFNLQNAAKGIYILTIEGNDIQLNQRVIVN